MAANTRHLDGYIGKSYNVGGVQVYVHKVIAEGGFGIVFLAKNSSNFNEPGARQWALKRVLVNNPDDLRNCRREIFIMQTNRNNPNIVCLEQGVINHQGGDIYEVLMLMEFCSSGNVLELMNQYFTEGKKLDEKLVLLIFHDIVKAVAALHQMPKPVIHRDLKVENVLLQGDSYKLCDFGSCTRNFTTPTLESVHSIEEDLQRYTTLAYRSPEMVDLYSNKTIDTRADIWALGVLLYKMCFFTLPFGESMVAIMEGNFKLPESSPYSKSMHSLICYLLTVELAARPDIFQVSYVVANMLCTPGTVKNTANSTIPSQLPEPPTLGQKRHQQRASLTPASAQVVTQTSLTPRSRPKVSQGTASNSGRSTANTTMPSSGGGGNATSAGDVDPFGSSRFGAPAAAAVAVTKTSVAPVARHRRVAVDGLTKGSTATTTTSSRTASSNTSSGNNRTQSSAASSPSSVPFDVFGAPSFAPPTPTTKAPPDPFGAPSFAPPTPTPTTKAPPDPFGAPSFAPPTAHAAAAVMPKAAPTAAAVMPKAAPTAAAVAGKMLPRAGSSRPSSPSSSSVMSSDSFDPRSMETTSSSDSFDPRRAVVGGAAAPSVSPLTTVTDPFGAALFTPAPDAAALDSFDAPLFGGECSPRPASPMTASPMTPTPRSPMGNHSGSSDPFNMVSFTSRLDDRPSSPSPFAPLPTSSTTSSGSAGKSAPAAVDMFGAPVFQAPVRSSPHLGHRRVSSDVTTLFHTAVDPFDAAPFVASAAHGHSASSSDSRTMPTFNAVPQGHPGGFVPIRQQSSDLMNFGRSVSPLTVPSVAAVPNPLARTAPSSPVPPFGAPSSVGGGGGGGGGDMTWGSKQNELLRQKEKLEERQRALLLQQQQLARQQQQLAHMQNRMAGSPSPTGFIHGGGGGGAGGGGQVFANPMAQQGRVTGNSGGVIKFAHASSLSPSGAILTGAALQQQQQMRMQQQQQPSSSPVFGRSHPTQFGMR